MNRRDIQQKFCCSMLLVIFCLSCSTRQEEERKKKSDSELLEQANGFIQEQKFKEALSYFEELHKRHPDQIVYLIQIGQIDVRLGDTKQAIAVYREGLKKEPENLNLLSALAFAYLFDQQFDASKELFHKILELDPKNADALSGLGYIAIEQNRLQEAEDYYQKALQIDPHHTSTLIYLGNLRTRQKRFDEAQKIFEGLSQEHPYNPDVEQGLKQEKWARERSLVGKQAEQERLDDVPNELNPHKNAQPHPVFFGNEENRDSTTEYLLDLAKIYRSQKRFKEGLEVNLRAYAIDPDFEEARNELAYGYLADSQWDKSYRAFKLLIHENPKNVEAYIGLGEIAFAIGDLNQAAWLYNEALQINPENVSALNHQASLYLSLKKYNQAKKDYQKIGLFSPYSPESSAGLKKVKEQPLLDRLQEIKESNRDDEEAALYEQLIAVEPSESNYWIKLAEIRYRQGKQDEAIKLYEKTLSKNPDSIPLRMTLAQKYLNQNDQARAEELFKQVLDQDSLNADGWIGLGTIAQRRKEFSIAEMDYEKALSISKNNATALGSIAELRIEQKRYAEAISMFESLLKQYPNEEWFKGGLRRARSQPQILLAIQYEQEKEYEAALAIYEGLIEEYPQVAEYYVQLGRVYVAMQNYDVGIDLYLKALSIDPQSVNTLKAIAFTYLYKAFEEDSVNGYWMMGADFPFIYKNPMDNVDQSVIYFSAALQLNPNDSEIYAGLGRLAAMYGCNDQAEFYYCVALDLNPDDPTALAFYAGFLNSQRQNFTSRDYYGYLLSLQPEDRETKTSYRNTLNSTLLSLTPRGFFHKENEWNPFLHRREASLYIYGGGVDAVYPVNDNLNLLGSVIDEYDVLKDFVSDTTSYAINVQRLSIGFQFDYSPYLTIYGGMGIAYAHQFRSTVSATQRKWLNLPSFGAVYTKCSQSLTLETFGTSDIIEQDFVNRKSKLFSGQSIQGIYQYDFGKNRLFGFRASNTWYEDWNHNQAQRGAAWLQLSPYKYWENIYLRYQFSFGRFNDLTVDYYTYQAQTTHSLSLNLTKSFLDDQLTLAAGYAHSWQRSFESGQQLVVTPLPFFHFIHRQINYGYGRIDYQPTDCLTLSFYGEYSMETFGYEIWNLVGSLNWKF